MFLEVWKYVKTKKRKKLGVSSIMSGNGDIVHDTKTIANILNRQYRKIFCDESMLHAGASPRSFGCGRDSDWGDGFT